MRLSLRFLVPLASVLVIIAYALSPLVDRLTLTWFEKDLDIRSQLIAETLNDSIIPLIKSESRAKIEALFNRVTRDERLLAIGFCDSTGHLIYKTQTLPVEINCHRFSNNSNQSSSLLDVSGALLHVSFLSVQVDQRLLGELILVHDTSFVKRRSADTKRYIFYLFLVLGTVISLITVFIAQMSWRGWISSIEAILKGEGIFRPLRHSTSPELKPILQDLRSLLRDLETDRKIRDDSHITWTAKTLKEKLKHDLAGEEIIVVSNREPYIHVHKEDRIEVQVPASGLVTAMEPIMRACSGTWIAHGSGSADREVVDEFNHVQVPPEDPAYSIRRVWLTPQEEQGYYYGLANEGIWPLCHTAHVSPIFRGVDWDYYVRVNEKFAKAVVEEAKTADPVVLVQDYHFALLAQRIRKELPRATIMTFWHIPWPNPEAFGICPWREEILEGLLGSSVVGFHTRFHCNNFLDTVDRYLECRIDRETSTLSYKGAITAVRHYPISIEWPPKWVKSQPGIEGCRKAVRERHGLEKNARVGIGVDRLDYTKGIPERFRAVERFLEKYPEWVGKFFFIQISAPTRSQIAHYQTFEREVTELAKLINRKFGSAGKDPIRLITEHHEPQQVFEYFRSADFCFVSSLHDGMNLVAKEFVASRDDEQGVLILSQFTGASRELPEALIVNPYDIDQCAAAIYTALDMHAREQEDRMRSMRELIKEYNVFRWAGRMLSDGARIRHRNRFFLRMGDGKPTNRFGNS